MKPLRTGRLVRRWVRLAVRVLIAAALLWLVLHLPLPRGTPQLFVMVEVPLAVFLFIVYTGKVFYDTFFYDRYQP